MAWTTDLLTGLAAHLAEHGPDDWAWRPTGPAYTAAEVGLVVGRMPATPDRVLALNTYPVRAGALSDVTVGIQIRARGPARTPVTVVNDLTDAVYDVLHGARGLVLGGVPVALLTRRSWTWLGTDAGQREETTSNFYAETAQPSAHVTD